MIWIIYNHKNVLEAPRAIPFDNDSFDIANEWIKQQENKIKVLDIAISGDGDEE